jgi:hypothetical protein
MAMSHSIRDESAYLDAEEARMPEIQREERLDSASRSQSAMGAAAKYLSAGDACKSAARRLRHPQVDHSEDHADSTGRQRVIGTVRPLK